MPVEDAMAKAIREALATETGSVLAFLPGQREIERTAERLAGRLPETCDIVPLYGQLDGRAQDAAIRPPPPGRRKVVLATSIAETSITIDGVRVVIDSGLSRLPRYEPATGLTRLETVRVSRASADQRAGRAGRTRAGHRDPAVARRADGGAARLHAAGNPARPTCPAWCSTARRSASPIPTRLPSSTRRPAPALAEARALLTRPRCDRRRRAG